MSTSSEKRLLEAARRCDGDTIEEIVVGGKTNLNVVDQIGCTAVHLCAKSADLSSLSLLLEKDANTDIFDNSGMCALHHAATKDYVETMALLISYGADINRTNKVNGMTPLHYATKNKHKRATEFLLFCGADLTMTDKDGSEAISFMSDSMRTEHRFIQDGFSKGHIRFSGKMLRPQTEYHFTSLELTIINKDSSSRSVCFFCRRIHLDYARNIIKDGEEVISDVYQYLVNQSSDCTTVTIPGCSLMGEFDEAFMRDHLGNEYECRTDTKGVCYTGTIALAAENDNQGYFMVAVKSREERFIVTGKAQTIQSKVEKGFRLEVPERSLPARSQVVLKVLPTGQRINKAATEDIRAASNFCEFSLSARQRRPIKVLLPLPYNLSDGSEVIVCHAEDNQTNETSWNIIGCQRDEGGTQVTVTEPTVGRGTAVVLGLSKKSEKGVFHRIKQFLSWLYNIVTKRIKPCVFCALTKSTDGATFRVLVILAEEKEIDKSVEKLKEENFQTEKTQKSSTLMVKPSDLFLLKLQGAQLNIQGESLFKMSFQAKRTAQHEFLVVSKEYEYGQLIVLKLKTDQIIDSRTFQSSECLIQLNVELRMKSAKEVYPSFTDFPDSTFLCELASEIGEEWFLLGVCLGLGSSFLETIQRQNSPVRTNQTLLYSWRADSDSLPDLGISTLIHALSKTGRNDLVNRINRQLIKIVQENPKEKVSLWATKLMHGLDEVDSSADMEDTMPDFNLLIPKETVPSPSSDLFLVQVSQLIGPDFTLFPLLGIGKETLESMKQTMSPETVMLKCLIQCRRRHGDDAIKFLDELLEALTVLKNNLAVEEIMKLFNQWLKCSANERQQNQGEPSNIDAFCEKFKHI